MSWTTDEMRPEVESARRMGLSDDDIRLGVFLAHYLGHHGALAEFEGLAKARAMSANPQTPADADDRRGLALADLAVKL